MGKIVNRQRDSGRKVNDRKYKAEGNYQHVKPKWEEDRLEKELFDTPSDERGYTASDEAAFQDFEEDLEEQDNLVMRRLLQEEEE